jgi:hypothetical protein
MGTMEAVDPAGAERRRFSRIPTRCEVVVKPVQDKAAFPAASTTREVGLGGCSFPSRSSYGVGSLLRLSILPKKSIIEATCRVTYEILQKNGTYEIGVAFLDIHPSDRPKLDALLSSRTSS